MTRAIAGMCLAALLAMAACTQEPSGEPASHDGGGDSGGGEHEAGAGGGAGEARGEGGSGSAGRSGSAGDAAAHDAGARGAGDGASGQSAEPAQDASQASEPDSGAFECPDGTICPEACAEGHVPVPTESECHERGPACYPLLDGSYCLVPQIDPCPPGFRSVPPGEPCDAADGCFQFSNDVNCTPDPD
jgi:hypothetical protein